MTAVTTSRVLIPHQAIVAQDTAAKRVLALGLVTAPTNNLGALVNNALYNPSILGCIGSFFYTSSFNRSMITQFSSIVTAANESESEAEFANAAKVVKLLAVGFWYPPSYCQFLQRFHQTKRFDHLVQNGHSYTGLMPSKFFKPISNAILPFGHELCRFILAPGKKASEALESLRTNLSLLDCGATRDIAAYRALLNLLGVEKFDLIFSTNPQFLLMIGGFNTHLNKLFQSVRLRSMKDVQPGDWCYFSNVHEYIVKHPAGLARGFNVICCSTNPLKFLGFGLDPNGATPDEIESALMDELNADPFAEELFAKQIWDFLFTKCLLGDYQQSRDLVESFKQAKITKADFKSLSSRTAKNGGPAQGKFYLHIRRPDLKRIQLLVNAPASQVAKFFAQMAPYNFTNS